MTLLASRRQRRELEAERARVSLNQLLRQAKRAWHGVKPEQPDWRDCSHSLAFSAEIRSEGMLVFAILNAYWEPLDFELPVLDPPEEPAWRRWIDTALDSPRDIVPWQAAEPISGRSYQAGARSVVLLLAHVAVG